MKFTKNKIRNLLIEMTGDPQAGVAVVSSPEEVPQEDDYDKVRGLLDASPEMVQQALNMVMSAAGATCPISTRQAIIDHLQDQLSPENSSPEEEILPNGASLGIPVGTVLEASRHKARLKRSLRESVRRSYKNLTGTKLRLTSETPSTFFILSLT